MNVLKAIKVAELRNKLSVIPAKLIIAAVLTVLIYWEKDMGFDIGRIWANIQADPKKYLIMLLIAYGAVSYVYFFIRLMHNWIFGLILSVGVAALVITQTGKLGSRTLLIALAVMLLGGPVLDIINLLRYHSLKKEVLRAEEERLEESYGDGYDDGYRKGIREGRRNERRRLREEEDYYRDDRHYIDRGYDEEAYGEDDFREGRRQPIGYSDDYDGGEYYEDEGYYEEEYDDGYSEEYIENEEYSYDRRITEGNSENAAGFFADCKSPSEIKRRYHDLCKVYHPDSGNGSAELFYRIKNEYDNLSGKLNT